MGQPGKLYDEIISSSPCNVQYLGLMGEYAALVGSLRSVRSLRSVGSLRSVRHFYAKEFIFTHSPTHLAQPKF